MRHTNTPNHSIGIRVAPQLKQALQYLAQKNGRSLSAEARFILRKEIDDGRERTADMDRILGEQGERS